MYTNSNYYTRPNNNNNNNYSSNSDRSSGGFRGAAIGGLKIWISIEQIVY